jgi:DNA polymerase-3 subunit gamma/tau
MSDTLAPDSGYRVLARKYRPANFDSLIGQEAMVKTLANAIARGALAHAWLLTGVRGVGKTSTARIIAKALNCVGADGNGGPTIAPCGSCDPCQAISAGRHIDVVEMDAASNTGVDDVREIIEAVRYAAVSARFKIYIIDEVHMLSKNAFNALLKTLEEPPPHVKFIFATTEVQKLPVTVLSRCQRFDLRRIPAEKLAEHFGKVAAAEGAEVDQEALELVARAAEGSVRDGLSILDQAIAHGHGTVSAQAVRDMLGLSDRGRVRDLMAALLGGDAGGALDNLRGQYDLGVNPDMVVQELLELTHGITRAKVAGVTDNSLAEAEREAVKDWAARLSFPSLHRLWQLLLKGLAEVQAAPLPIQAAEMALLRVIHASALPDPGELVRKLTATEGQDGPRAETPRVDAREPELQMAAGAGMAAAPAAASVADGSAPAAPSAVADVARGGSDEPATSAAMAPSQPERSLGRPPAAPVPLRPAAEPDATVPIPPDFAALVTLFDDKREPLLAQMLHDDARLVRYAPPVLDLNIGRAPADFAQRVMRCLQLWTGERWTVSLTEKPGQPTLRDAAAAAREAERQAVLADPAVRKLMTAFPNAELIDFGVDPNAPPASSDGEDDMRRA